MECSCSSQTFRVPTKSSHAPHQVDNQTSTCYLRAECPTSLSPTLPPYSLLGQRRFSFHSILISFDAMKLWGAPCYRYHRNRALIVSRHANLYWNIHGENRISVLVRMAVLHKVELRFWYIFEIISWKILFLLFLAKHYALQYSIPLFLWVFVFLFGFLSRKPIWQNVSS